MDKKTDKPIEPSKPVGSFIVQIEFDNDDVPNYLRWYAEFKRKSMEDMEDMMLD